MTDAAVPEQMNEDKNYIVEATVPEVKNKETNYILKAVVKSDEEEIKVKKEEEGIKDPVSVDEAEGYEKDGSKKTETYDKICDVQEEHAEKEIVKVCDMEQGEDKEVESDRSVEGGDRKDNVEVRDVTQPEEEKKVDSDESDGSVEGADGKENVKVRDVTQHEEKHKVDSDESVKVIEIIQCEHVDSVKRVAGDERKDKECVCKEIVDRSVEIVDSDSDEGIAGEGGEKENVNVCDVEQGINLRGRKKRKPVPILKYVFSSDSKSDTTASDEELKKKSEIEHSIRESEVSDSTFKGIYSSSRESRRKRNVTVSSDEGRSTGSVRLSQDDSKVKVSWNFEKLTIVDKPPRLRLETRGQYLCRLALQFTRNQHKKVTQVPSRSDSDESVLYACILNICLSPILERSIPNYNSNLL